MPAFPSRLLLLSLPLAFAGCASLQPDAGLGRVQQDLQTRLPAAALPALSWDKTQQQDAARRAQIAALLKQPLSADTAVRVALLDNGELQARFAELGVSDAERVIASRLPNPLLALARQTQGGSVEIDRGVVFDLLSLLSLPARRDIASRRYEETRLATAAAVVELATATRKAYYDAVAAAQTTRYLGQVQEAADAAAELARNMAKVGNFSERDALREELFYAEASTQLAQARLAETATREALIRRMGLWGTQTAFTLPGRLPDLPDAPPQLGEVEASALRHRLDVQMAKAEIQGLAQSLGLTRATRFVNVLDAGYLNNSYSDQPRQTGAEVQLLLPVFDWGDARSARAEALYLQALGRTRDLAVRARSQAREAYLRLRTAYDVAAQYRRVIIPLRQRIGAENQLRYNGMLISVFELLSDARAQILAVNGAIRAQRDYWDAEADLQNALAGAAPRFTALDIARPLADAANH